MYFGMRPRSDSRWLRWLGPAESLAERFGVAVERLAEPPLEARPVWRSDVGFRGELEVARLLAETGDLNLFRPFPDSETAELAVLHLNTRSVVGLQVKTVDVDADRMRATVNVYGPSFRPAPSTFIVVLAWLRDQSRFHDDCLLIPTVELVDIAHDDGNGHLAFDWLPRSATPDPFAKYRVSINALRARVTGLVAV
jgi:hypothetical protein